jgi:hypothetical protein
MQKHQEPDQLNALNLDVGKRVLKRVDGLSGEWHAATVTSIAFDQANNEKTYTLQFDHDGGAEILGAVAMRKLLLDSRLKEMTMQRYLETNPGPLSDEEDILGQDMIAYMAQHTQKLAAESEAVLSNTQPQASKKRKTDSNQESSLKCANRSCQTHNAKRFQLYKLKDSRKRERYCEKHAMERTSDTYVLAEFVDSN